MPAIRRLTTSPSKHWRSMRVPKLSKPFARTSRRSMLLPMPTWHLRNWKRRTLWWTDTITMWRRKPCAVASWTKESVWTDVRLLISVPSGVRQVPCLVLTEAPSSPVVRHSHLLPAHSEPRPMRNWWTMCLYANTSVSCCTTTSLPSPPVKLRLSVA